MKENVKRISAPAYNFDHRADATSLEYLAFRPNESIPTMAIFTINEAKGSHVSKLRVADSWNVDILGELSFGSPGRDLHLEGVPGDGFIYTYTRDRATGLPQMVTRTKYGATQDDEYFQEDPDEAEIEGYMPSGGLLSPERIDLTYTNKRQLSSLIVHKPGSAEVASFVEIKYDDLGRVRSIIEADGAALDEFQSARFYEYTEVQMGKKKYPARIALQYGKVADRDKEPTFNSVTIEALDEKSHKRIAFSPYTTEVTGSIGARFVASGLFPGVVNHRIPKYGLNIQETLIRDTPRKEAQKKLWGAYDQLPDTLTFGPTQINKSSIDVFNNDPSAMRMTKTTP